MTDQNMATALFAEMPVAHLGLPVAADKLRALRDLHVVLFPQNVRAHRCAGMSPAGAAMAVTHLERRAGDLDRHRAAKAGAAMRFVHDAPTLLVRHIAFETAPMKCPPSGTFRRARSCHQIGVPCEHPAPVRLLTQNCQRET